MRSPILHLSQKLTTYSTETAILLLLGVGALLLYLSTAIGPGLELQGCFQ